jgi:steroid delta-isomerase-like uncharacterized protein
MRNIQKMAGQEIHSARKDIRSTEMHQRTVAVEAAEEVLVSALVCIKNGDIDGAAACFAEPFRFKDHGIGLEFIDKSRLRDFFQKRREFFPDSLLHINSMFVNGDQVVAEWTFQGTKEEPFYSGLSRKIPIVFHGVSIVRTDKGKIVDWSEYYDGLASRRSTLAAHFTPWIEL